MDRNDMKSVVYLILALVCFYYLMDDFFGKQKISTWVNRLVGDFGGIAAPIPAAADPQTAPAADPAAAKSAAQPDLGKVKIPAAQPDLGKVKIPQPQGAPALPKTKSGTRGWSLPDFNPLPWIAGGAAAITGGAIAAGGALEGIGGALEGILPELPIIIP
jgi:hypothetical protein